MPLDKLAQGPAISIVPGSEEDDKDVLGLTHPNLHRRIEDDIVITPDEQARGILSKNYDIGVYGNDSYRHTKVNTHDEDSTTSEIP